MDARVDRPILLDNTVLTNFALVGRDDLVMRLWPTRACTTQAALGEYKAGVGGDLLPSDAWARLPVVELTRGEVVFASGLSSRLGAGERTCLAAAVHRRGLLASDDLDARHVAQEHSVPQTGTIGILILCVRRGYLLRDQANALLGDMISLGYRSPVVRLDSLLNGS